MGLLGKNLPHSLNSVVVPCLNTDIPKIESTLSVWLSDRFAPTRSRWRKRPVFMVVLNHATPAELAEARQILDGIAGLRKYFSVVEVHSANLDGDMDLYVRNSPVAAGRFGNKAGPNFLFQRAMHLASRHGSFTVQMELDCLPISAGWLDRLANLLTHQHAWVIGTPYLGDRPLDRRVQFHVNGNGLYHCGSPEFLDFLDDVWIARLNKLRSSQPNLAYDCWWSFEMTRANAIVRNESWEIWQKYAMYIHLEPFMVNLNVRASEVGVYLEVLDNLRVRGLDPVLLHGPGISHLIETLASDRRLGLRAAIEKVETTLRDVDTEITQSGLSETAEGSDDMPSYPNFIVPNNEQRPEAIPRVLLTEGFHHIEGPSNRFYPVRYVWTSETEFEIIPFSTEMSIPLMFRNGGTEHMRKDTLPRFTATQEGRDLVCKCELMPHPVYGRVTISGKQLQAMKPITIRCDAPLFEEQSQRKRQLGVLLLETGVKFAKF